MTNFEKLTASPEALAAFLASIAAVDTPWETHFQKAVCPSCQHYGQDCGETCPNEAARNNPAWWLAQETDDTAPASYLDYKAVFAHFGIDLDEYKRKVQESGGSLSWGISGIEKVKEQTADMAGFGTEQSQRIIIDFDKEYGTFLVRQELGIEPWQAKPGIPPRL